MPQTSNADIIVTDISANPAQVGFSSGFGTQYTFDNLPGAANSQFGFRRDQRVITTTVPTSLGYLSTTLSVLYRTVTVGRQAGSLMMGAQGTPTFGFVVPQAGGANWNPNIDPFFNLAVGLATTFFHSPQDSYNHQYLGWMFQDTTANALRYGWVEIGLSIGNSFGPDVTIYRYAFQDDGTQITMGAVPEPAPIAILALGALTMGAKGVRAWRRNRTRETKS